MCVANASNGNNDKGGDGKGKEDRWQRQQDDDGKGGDGKGKEDGGKGKDGKGKGNDGNRDEGE